MSRRSAPTDRPSRRRLVAVAGLLVPLAALLAACMPTHPGNDLISLTVEGQPRDRPARGGVISSDGRYVAFWSRSSDLVPGDTNARSDVFRFDIATRTTIRVSVTRHGGQLADGADLAAVSGDGTSVAFRTSANLESADTDNNVDIYVRDLTTNIPTFESLAGFDTEANFQLDLSDDARMVTFVSDTPVVERQAYVRDRVTNVLHLVTPRRGTTEGSNGIVIDLGISRDGQHVAYSSSANDLVADDTNNQVDAFVATIDGREVVLVSRDPSGAQLRRSSQGGSLADGGRVVAFQSESDLVVPGDTNGVTDVFVNRR